LLKKIHLFTISVCVQATIIRDFRGVDPAQYHQAISAQTVACPRITLNKEETFKSPTTGDTPRNSEDKLAENNLSENSLSNSKLNDSDDFFESSVSVAFV
jgi:hypothetical protein